MKIKLDENLVWKWPGAIVVLTETKLRIRRA